MSVNTKYTDKPNDQYQRANLKGLVGYFHKRFNYSDSFPLTDIYGDLKYRINLTDTIGNWHDRAVKIQSYLADRFHDYFYTTDSTLVLTLADGKESIFAKWDSVNAEGYTFEHYFDKIDYYLLRVQWGEGNCWMLVNRKNGFKKYIKWLTLHFV
jgi:hypothetical protein